MATAYFGRGDLVVKRLGAGPLHRPWRIASGAEVRDVARRLPGSLVVQRRDWPRRGRSRIL